MIKKILKCFIGKYRYQGLWKKLYTLSLRGMNIGGGSDFMSSGEEKALLYVKNNVIKGKRNPVIFDVGANVGGYTQEVLKLIPNAQVHSFEPAAVTYSKLCMNVGKDRAILNNFGLSNSANNGILYYDEEASGMASLYNRQLDYFGVDLNKTEEVKLSTLDIYCAENQISIIDFLKMDVEGNEFEVLEGSKKMLEEGNILAIQMEFGGASIDSRHFLRDFWNLLHDRYRMYRIVQDGLVEIEKYYEQIEVFSCTNYMFIHK